MENRIERLQKQYKSRQTSKSEYLIGAKKYAVTRHFTGDKDINKLVIELATAQANREMGLS